MFGAAADEIGRGDAQHHAARRGNDGDAHRAVEDAAIVSVGEELHIGREGIALGEDGRKQHLQQRQEQEDRQND